MKAVETGRISTKRLSLPACASMMDGLNFEYRLLTSTLIRSGGYMKDDQQNLVLKKSQTLERGTNNALLRSFEAKKPFGVIIGTLNYQEKIISYPK